MQSGVPSLPVVCSDKHSCSSSKYSDSVNGTPRKSKSPYSSSTHLSKRKSFYEMHANSPYRSHPRFHPLSQPSRLSKNSIGQRVLSAKMLRVKQLQNQLTDAHFHLNELSNENKLLKAIQKKQESALKKYEGTNAELPRIINSHHEELRILQMKHKKLKEQHKITRDNLKEKEKDLNSLQTFNKRLLQLSQDRNLLEREKLQTQNADLNFQIQQQQESIQTLNKKLALETKSLKQQIHSEVGKHKETQKHLQDTLEKLKSLEELLDNREKRMYYNNQLPSYNKSRYLGNHSVSSLEDSGLSLNNSKLNMKKTESSSNENILPTLSDLDMNFERKVNGKIFHDNQFNFNSEKKLRISKSATRTISTTSLDRLEKLPTTNIPKKPKNEDDTTNEPIKEPINVHLNDSLNIVRQEIEKINEGDAENKILVDDFEDFDSDNLSDELRNMTEEVNLQHENLFKKSREVYTRLTSNVSPTESVTAVVHQHSDYEEMENKVKAEFKFGQDFGTNMLMNLPKSFYHQHGRDEERLQTLPLMSKPKTDDSKTAKETADEGEEEEIVIDDYADKIFQQTLKLENGGSPKGGKTYRHSPHENDLNIILEKLNLKDVKPKDSESEKKAEVEETKEKLDIYVNGDDKSKKRNNSLEKVGESSTEVRKNSAEKLNKNNEKKEGDKATKKSFDKDKLLAEMKAIDNNDNIEYYDQKVRRNSGSMSRSQITENLYRGIPTQRRSDLSTIVNSKLENKAKDNGIYKISLKN